MEEEYKPLSATDWLSADRPIESRSEDLLGRRDFSEALAAAIRGWTGRDSLVIALYGAWGNGKSSIKNMMVECLAATSPALRVIDFNPWQRANRPQLGAAFFDELGIALGKGDLGSNEHRRRALNRSRRWASRLRGGQEIAKLLRSTLSAVFIMWAATLVGSEWIHSRALSIALGLLVLSVGLLSFSSKFVDAAITFFEAGVDTGAKSLGEVKAEVAADLQEMKAPILAVLDDLDRLTPTELLETFQLIKANGDFPNLIHLVLCDRKIVEDSISKALNVPGRDYLEKVVQVAFDVPMIDAARTRLVLLQGLNSLLSHEGISKRFVEKRWANIFWSSLGTYFVTLRDVNRFLSTLAFHIALLSSDGLLEVNPIDLIGLEAMRLYEPEVYKALQANKALLTAMSKAEKPEATIARQMLSAIVDSGSKDHKGEITALIKHLFPTVEWAFDGPSYMQDYGQRWYRDLRVCSAKVFDRYFRLAISGGELSQVSSRRLLDARGDRERLRSELEMLFAQDLGDLALEELAVYQDEVAAPQVDAFITAIFDIGDKISDAVRQMFEVPRLWRAGYLIQHCLEKLQDVDARASVLGNAMRNTTGLILPLEFLDLITPDSSDGSNSGKGRLLPEHTVLELRKIGIQKLRDAASSGALASHQKVARLINFWRKWGQPKEASEYADEITKSEAGILRLLKSFVLRSTGHQLGDYVATERRYIRGQDIELLIAADVLEARLKHFPLEKLTEEEGVAVRAFEEAMERRRAGKSDDDPFARD